MYTFNKKEQYSATSLKNIPLQFHEGRRTVPENIKITLNRTNVHFSQVKMITVGNLLNC